MITTNTSSSHLQMSLMFSPSTNLQNLMLRRALLKKLSSQNPKLLSQLFNQQISFVKDSSRYKTAICSRRAGKSFALASYLLDIAIKNPNTFNPYIGLTRKSAKRIMWPIFKRITKDAGIKCQFKEADLEIHFENRSMIFLCGANDESTSENLRGNPYKLVCIDECASYRGHIDTLVDEILIPALVDNRGSMCLVGTPSPDFESYFYKATTDKRLGWSTHHWTMFDNPHIIDANEFIEDIKQKRGWSDDNPILLREYFGKWTKSLDDMIYRFNPLKNVYSELPKFKMNKVIGMDIGYNDGTAFVVLGFNIKESPNVYLLDCSLKTKLTTSEAQEHLLKLVREHNPISIVADSGALGKMIVEEMKQRTGLHINAAEKAGKMAFIELVNADLCAGKIKVDEEHAIIKEWNSLMKIKNAQGKLVEDPSVHNDISDAFLYAYRECHHYFHKEKVVSNIVPGSIEYYQQQENEMLKVISDKYKQQRLQEQDQWI